MHINAIRNFIAEYPPIKDRHLTTSEINKEIIKTQTLGTEQPFIHKYTDISDPKTGVPYISLATVFISHAWRYKFYDVVVAVMEQYASKDPDAYFWFDLFTNDQNKVGEKDFNWFSFTFLNSIKNIGKVLLILSPWDDPISIKRAWCLFEIYQALEENSVEFTIDLPDSQNAELKAAVTENPKCVIQALSNIQAQNAAAAINSDREMIFKVIQESDGGFSHVN